MKCDDQPARQPHTAAPHRNQRQLLVRRRRRRRHTPDQNQQATNVKCGLARSGWLVGWVLATKTRPLVQYKYSGIRQSVQCERPKTQNGRGRGGDQYCKVRTENEPNRRWCKVNAYCRCRCACSSTGLNNALSSHDLPIFYCKHIFSVGNALRYIFRMRVCPSNRPRSYPYPYIHIFWIIWSHFFFLFIFSIRGNLI